MPRYNQLAEEIFTRAKQIAWTMLSSHVTDGHLWLAMRQQTRGLAGSILKNFFPDHDELYSFVRQTCNLIAGDRPSSTFEKLPWTVSASAIARNAEAEANALGHDYVGPEHILLAAITYGMDVGIGGGFNVNPEEIKIRLLKLLGHAPEKPEEKQASHMPVRFKKGDLCVRDYAGEFVPVLIAKDVGESDVFIPVWDGSDPVVHTSEKNILFLCHTGVACLVNHPRVVMQDHMPEVVCRLAGLFMSLREATAT